MSSRAPHNPDPRPLRIVVVDEHPVLRSGLAHELRAHGEFSVVGEAGTGRDAIEQVELKRPDIVVLDTELPDTPGLELLPRLLHKAGPRARVLVLCAHGDPVSVERAFAAGVHGYLLKDAAGHELCAAICALAAGERYVYPPLGAMLAGAVPAPPDGVLSHRERSIARMLGLGHTNQEVAAAMFLSVRTVETHRAHVMAKLGIGARSELTRWTLDQGLLDERG